MPVPDWFADLLHSELARWMNLSDDQIARLYEHYQLLEHWNKQINLTSIKPGREMVLRHYCESLFFGAQLANDSNDSIADIGSGAGFPGVPIAILKPECSVTLVESNQRKAVFLREATRKLSNTAVVASRAKDLTSNYGWLVSRAVAPEEILALVPRLATRLGLMLGENDVLELLRTREPAHSAKHIAWSEPIRLPWGDRTFCVFGCFT
jgi:16S rRNA (guanine(527)-N(7))-methyltransferase RsmG